MSAVDNIDLLRLLAEKCATTFAEAPDRADVSVAGDLAHVIEILAAAPNAFRLVLSDEGDAPANEDQPETGVIRQTVAIYVAMAAGLPARVAAGAWQGKPGGKPALLEKCNVVRDLVRSLRIVTDTASACEERFEYTGRQPVLDGAGAPMHAYRLSFQIYTALPEPEPLTVSI